MSRLQFKVRQKQPSHRSKRIRGRGTTTRRACAVLAVFALLLIGSPAAAYPGHDHPVEAIDELPYAVTAYLNERGDTVVAWETVWVFAIADGHNWSIGEYRRLPDPFPCDKFGSERMEVCEKIADGTMFAGLRLGHSTWTVERDGWRAVWSGFSGSDNPYKQASLTLTKTGTN